MARILGALCAGSAVMFAAAVAQDGPQFTGDGGVVAGAPQSDGTTTKPPPEIAAAPQDSALRTTGNDTQPVIALPSNGTRVSPTRAGAHEGPDASDVDADQPVRWAPSTSPDWETSLREALAQQAPTPAEPAPTGATQNPPTSDDADQSDSGVVEDVLGHLGAGS